MSNKTSPKFHKSVLQQNNPLNEFVVTPIHKVHGNVAFICQQFYALVLMKERDVDHNNTGTKKTFIPVHKTNNQIISGRTTFLRSKFRLVVDFFFYGNEHLHNKHKNNSHLAPWLLWVPGIQKKVINKRKN